MGDPICKWRKVSTENIIEMVSWLPKNVCTDEEYRTHMQYCTIGGPAYLRTAYQLSCQLGLQYVDENGLFHPRFNHDITAQEAEDYLRYWITRYYVPNPYARRRFGNIHYPVILLYAVADVAATRGNQLTLQQVCDVIFGETTGNIDQVENMLHDFSNILHIGINHIVSANNQNIPEYHVYNDKNDKAAFFNFFNR